MPKKVDSLLAELGIDAYAADDSLLQRGPEFLEQFRSAWERSPIRLVARQLLCWPED